MPTPDVIEKMRALRAELANTQPSPEKAGEVAELREHVEAVLNDPDQRQHYTSLSDRLQQAVVGFQLEHPKLAAAIDGAIAELTAAGL